MRFLGKFEKIAFGESAEVSIVRLQRERNEQTLSALILTSQIWLGVSRYNNLQLTLRGSSKSIYVNMETRTVVQRSNEIKSQKATLIARIFCVKCLMMMMIRMAIV